MMLGTRLLLAALALGCVVCPAAAAAEARYRGFEDQNQRVRLVYDKQADRVAFRIGYIAHCVGTGGESEGDEGAAEPLVAKGARVRVARDGTFADRFRMRVDRRNNRDGIGPDELHRRFRIAITGRIEGRRRAHGTIRVRYKEVQIDRETGVVFRFESSCDSDVRRWETPRFEFTGPWRPTGPVPLGDPELLLALTDGELLAFGGNEREANPDPPRAVTYRPDRNRWRRTRPPAHARRQPAGVVLRDGRVLVAGGSETTLRGRLFQDRTLRAAETYDPRTRRWTPTSPLALRRHGARAELLPDGRVLIVGGSQSDVASRSTASAEIFDPETRRFTGTAPMPSALNPLYSAALPSGRILCVGQASDASDRAFAFDPSSETWSPVDLPPEFEFATGVTKLDDGRVFATASAFEGETRREVAAIFTEGVGWAMVSPPPATPLSGRASVLLPSGRVLVPLQDVEPGDSVSQRAATYDPATDTWELAAPYFHPYTQYPYLAATEGGALAITDGPTALTRTERFFE